MIPATARLPVPPPPAPAPAEQPIRLRTRFGDFASERRHVLSFPAGLPGFEQCRDFVLLSGDAARGLQCLHAVTGPRASFLAIDPRQVLADYRCRLAAEDRERLAAGADAPLLWLALLTFDADGAAFANLRAPIVINPAAMRGFQIAPRDTVYPLRHPVSLE